MIERNFKPGGKAILHRKDTNIAMAAAREKGMYLPGTCLASQLWNAMEAHGFIDLDHSAMVKVLEMMSNIEVCPGE